MRTATRYYCVSASSAGSGFHHTSGDGLPRRKKCAHCGGRLVSQSGHWGVFVWAGDGRYPLANAVRVFSVRAAAERCARATEDLVVRWISNGEAGKR